ncbi:MAG TPA: hypothetical protein ENF38_00625 [Candidatus Aenigmarchaeota archaeon]|nr:hypothetical protein [Candidatus Aenigmarchaeota archaeon]
MGLKEQLQERWTRLSPESKKKVSVLALVLIFFVCLFPLYKNMQAKKEKPKVEKKEVEVFDFGKGNFLEEHWVVKATRQLEKQKETIADLEAKIAQLQRRLEQQPKTITIVKEGTKTEKKQPEKGKLPSVKKEKEKLPYPPPPYPPPTQVTQATIVQRPEKLPNYIMIVSVEKIATSLEEEKEEKEEEKIKSYGYVPSGSFVKGVLLTGVDAPTGNIGRSNPYPVLIRLMDLSFLPNRVRFNVQDCFVTGEAVGELSTERVNIRTDMLSCITQDGQIIDTPIQGYVVDVDGKVGLAGHPVTKQGALIARSLIAGFLKGVGEAFQLSSTVVTVSPLGTTSQILPNTSGNRRRCE